MEPRDVLKAQCYARLVKEEMARMNIFMRLIGKRPKIRSTSEIVGIDYEAVRADVNSSKIFTRTTTSRAALCYNVVIPGMMCAMGIASVFINGAITTYKIIFGSVVGGVFLLITYPFLRRLLSAPSIEIKATGIRLNKCFYAWTQVLDTYIVIKKGRGAESQLVLLTDKGQIIRIALGDFSTLQHNAAFDISYYIEHYKRLRYAATPV